VHEAILFALALTFAAEAWLVTRPQPRFGTTPATQRWLIRATAGLQVAQIGAVGLGTTAGSIPLLLVAWFFSLSFAAFPAMLMLHLRRLALRVLDPRLAEHCAIIGCGASAALLLLTASAFAPNWLFRGPHGRWFGYAEVFVSAVGLLCVLWSVLTLLRFALAFGKAWRASRDAWDAADASAVVPGNSAPIGHTGA